MLIELWERLRGYHEWVETEANIESFQTVRKRLGRSDRIPRTRNVSSDLLVWRDQHGRRHYGPFVNLDTSPLYQLLEGETIRIRYDPANPDRYYNRAYFLAWVTFATKATAAVALAGGFIVWRIWMIVTRRGF